MKRGEALAILVGTQIGAGVLGLPYAAKSVGLIPALAVLVAVMLLMLFTARIVLDFSARIVLDFSARMNGAQLSTIAKKALGRGGGVLMFVSVTIMSFGALLAYIAGMGSVFSSLFGISETLGAIIFWALASLVIYLGLEASGKSELIMSFFMLILFLVVAVMLLPKGRLENALYMSGEGLWAIVGVSIFALGCHTVIPDVYKGLGSYEETKRLLTWAFIIPTVIYALFMASFLLVFGQDTPQIATQALEKLYGRTGLILGNLIPLFAITTSYIGIGLAQLSNVEEYLRVNRKLAWVLTVIPPLVVYLSGVGDFVSVLGVAGDTGDLMAFIVLPLVIYLANKLGLVPMGGEAGTSPGD
ncbi:aromatic amino acid transport family protein [Pyrococcus yayanosii]|uniref:Aromatic amino acid permease n=1 Tax=Pyrococcus yayanosii (strain CH1 / JCM 16557) TaxID=529709 RepID=F8AFM6_PYRYC|nr:aromatic amino acid transport family protein [Pyrococcus yayanosii]AEH24992.1 aromatic amino acid permease [Pyrococcus yayanosii CH1]